MYSDNCSCPIWEYSRPLAIRCVCKHTDGTANATVLGAFHLIAWKLVCSNATVLGAFHLVAWKLVCSNATVLGAFHLVAWKVVCSNATVLGAFHLVANLHVVFIHGT